MPLSKEERRLLEAVEAEGEEEKPRRRKSMPQILAKHVVTHAGLYVRLLTGTAGLVMIHAACWHFYGADGLMRGLAVTGVLTLIGTFASLAD